MKEDIALFKTQGLPVPNRNGNHMVIIHCEIREIAP